MLCPKCHTELPDEAQFCWKCGEPQQPPTSDAVRSQSAAAVPDYDYCDIRFMDRLFGFYYEARHEHAVIARSRDSIRTRREANQDVVDKLAADGWEPMTRDKAGMVTRMRRLKSA